MYPSDWPRDGPIDLTIHDKPHQSSSTEWWYLNCHLRTQDGRESSVFASFFRLLIDIDVKTKRRRYAHSIAWALSDADSQRYFSSSLLDKNAPEIGLKKVERGEGTKDERLRRAMREVLERGKIPHPDRMFKNEPSIGHNRLDLDFDGNCLRRQDDGSYVLKLIDDCHNIKCDLVFVPQKEAVRHGDNGVVEGIDGGDMFYYFIPRCKVSGCVWIYGQRLDIVRGNGWYDHEFGVASQDHANQDKPSREVAWNWAGVQLEDGSEISACNMKEIDTGRTLDQKAIIIRPDGSTEYYDSISFEPQNSWRSTRTFNDYPTRWKLEIPDAGLACRIDAVFEDQEFITVISKPSFWEGRARLEGELNGTPISGLGYVERSGYATINSLDDFFAAVGEVVAKSVREIIPFDPSYEQVRDLVASKERDHYMGGVHIPQFVDTLIRPIREIVDRGGKSWRSYAALACCDVVGGDSRRFVQWLAMPELMHVGSLIVDDVEDRSHVRRGGPTCHVIHGEPLAINAGTAAYFMGQKLLSDPNITNAEQVRLYDLYFEVLRAGHAGQAIDIDGMDSFMPEVVETGQGRILEERVLAVHRLKTGVPAGTLSRMGAVAGGGSEEQIEAVGNYMESIGLAFQIIDDVLDVRGFSKKLKRRGEDIRQGKVTLPFAKAMSILSREERQRLWATLSSKPQDDVSVAGVIETMESCGAVESCVTQANEIIENAWIDFDRLIEDSFVKLMLRAFGWYVLNRHY